MKLLFEQCNFIEPLLSTVLLYFQSSNTFSQELFSQKMFFIRTANFGLLIVTVTFFIYNLENNLGVFRFKLPKVHRVVHHSKDLSIKYHEQKFCIRFAFFGQHLTRLSIGKFKNLISGVLMKISISVLNQLINQQFILVAPHCNLFS